MTFQKNGKMSVRFRNLNIFFFILASILIMSVMFIVLRNITNTVSKDYAKMYSSETLGTLNTYFSGEIALLRKAANSNSILNWLDDEENQEKRLEAYDEMMETIRQLRGKNLYIGVEKTWNEFSVGYGDSIDDIQPFAKLDPEYFNDAWYFDCISSDKEYLLNVDIDKVHNRMRVWLNYKMIRDDKVYGVLCTGMEFSGLVGNLFDKYDDKNTRSLVIDENGVIQMDSTVNDYIVYQIEDEHSVINAFADEIFLSAIDTYLEGIDGYFTMDSPIAIIEMPTGQFHYAAIAPINATSWSVITLYDSSALFDMREFIPLIATMLILFIIYIFATNFISNRYVLKPFENLYEKTSEQNEMIVSNNNYASKIQKNLLPNKNVLDNAFSDYSIIWEPRDIVGGDIYWAKNFDDGTVLCVCDCTGHGTSGALLTMLVVSSLETIVTDKRRKDTSEIMYMLDKRLVSVLNVDTKAQTKRCITDIDDGCDLAVLFIAKDGSVEFSSANIPVFICDGKEVTQYKGQKIFIGEGKLKSKDDAVVHNIPTNPNNKFYIASDGLYDQKGGIRNKQFGYLAFKQIILENHYESQAEISRKVWDAYEEYRGQQSRRDDFELITFKP